MPDTHPIRILVVDDEATVRQSIKLALAGEGYSIDMAASGEEALRQGALAGYDLVLADMMMPGVSGLDLLKGIQVKDPAARVVIITGYPTDKAAAQSFRMGAVDFLPKPFAPAELRAAVARAFAGRARAAGTKV
jgi:DNA-binding NtrC family response regulator